MRTTSGISFVVSTIFRSFCYTPRATIRHNININNKADDTYLADDMFWRAYFTTVTRSRQSTVTCRTKKRESAHQQDLLNTYIFFQAKHERARGLAEKCCSVQSTIVDRVM